jgi:hypothetical protein
VGGHCVPTGGGIYIDCGVSKTYGLSSIGDSEGGDGAVGCSCSSEEWKMVLMGYLMGVWEEIENETTSGTVHLPEVLGILSS